jgi:hypothetical protein
MITLNPAALRQKPSTFSTHYRERNPDTAKNTRHFETTAEASRISAPEAT